MSLEDDTTTERVRWRVFRSSQVVPLQEHLLMECEAMARHALRSGSKVPPEILRELESVGESIRRANESVTPSVSHGASRLGPTGHLAKIHNRLVDLVAPSSPSSILLLEKETRRSAPLNWLGPVPLVRRLMVVALLSLALLVMASLSSDVDGTASKFSLLLNDGRSLFLNQLFLLGAASLGASFANLSLAHQHLRIGDFDSRFESTYWIRHLLGIMSGTLMACLIPIEQLLGSTDGSSVLHGLEKPTLAMLGGFSASLVYRILSHVMLALETLIQGNSIDSDQAERAQLEAQNRERRVASRLELAAKLTSLQRDARSTADPKHLHDQIDELVTALLDDDSTLISEMPIGAEHPAT